MLYKCLCFGDQCAERELSPRSQDFKSSPLTTRSRCLFVNCVFRMYVDKPSNDIEDKRMPKTRFFYFSRCSVHYLYMDEIKTVTNWFNFEGIFFVWAVGVAYVSNSMKRYKLKENAKLFSSEYPLYY